MDRKEILHTAEKCVCGDREQDYGRPEDNFSTIAKLWSTYLKAAQPFPIDLHIRPQDVAAMMSLLKIAHVAAGNAKVDSWVDLAGYAACGGEIETRGAEE